MSNQDNNKGGKSIKDASRRGSKDAFLNSSDQKFVQKLFRGDSVRAVTQAQSKTKPVNKTSVPVIPEASAASKPQANKPASSSSGRLATVAMDTKDQAFVSRVKRGDTLHAMKKRTHMTNVFSPMPGLGEEMPEMLEEEEEEEEEDDDEDDAAPEDKKPGGQDTNSTSVRRSAVGVKKYSSTRSIEELDDTKYASKITANDTLKAMRPSRKTMENVFQPRYLTVAEGIEEAEEEDDDSEDADDDDASDADGADAVPEHHKQESVVTLGIEDDLVDQAKNDVAEQPIHSSEEAKFRLSKRMGSLLLKEALGNVVQQKAALTDSDLDDDDDEDDSQQGADANGADQHDAPVDDLDEDDDDGWSTGEDEDSDEMDGYFTKEDRSENAAQEEVVARSKLYDQALYASVFRAVSAMHSRGHLNAEAKGVLKDLAITSDPTLMEWCRRALTSQMPDQEFHQGLLDLASQHLQLAEQTASELKDVFLQHARDAFDVALRLQGNNTSTTIGRDELRYVIGLLIESGRLSQEQGRSPVWRQLGDKIAFGDFLTACVQTDVDFLH